MVSTHKHIHILSFQTGLLYAWQCKNLSNHLLGNYRSFLSGICSFPDLFKKKNKPHNILNSVVLCNSTDTVIAKEKTLHIEKDALEFKLFNKNDGELFKKKNLNLRKHKRPGGTLICITL